VGPPPRKTFFFNFHFFATYDEKMAFWDPKIFGGQGPPAPKILTPRGSINTSLETARRAEENAVYRMSLALSKPEILGFQICIRYTLKASIDKTTSLHS